MTADNLLLGYSGSKIERRKKETCRHFYLQLLDRQHLLLTLAHPLQTYRQKLETQLILIVAGCGKGIVLLAANGEKIKGTALKALPYHPCWAAHCLNTKVALSHPAFRVLHKRLNENHRYAIFNLQTS